MWNARTRRFLRDAEGAMGVYGLILFLTIAMFAGLSLDVANAYKVRSIVQVAADNAGHTALLYRTSGQLSAADAIAKAIAVANTNLGKTGVGNVITASDIVFGHWDEPTQTFTADPTSKEAVRVTARRDRTRGNGVKTFLLSAAGLAAWDVKAESVTETYRPGCLREGFVGEKIVDLQSNNGFYNGFCLHSNGHVEVNQNNYFEAGTVVSMPNTDNLQLPASGFAKNTGLLAALRESFYNIRILQRIKPIMDSLMAGQATYRPDYITNYTVQTITVSSNSMTFSTANLPQGKVYYVSCSGNKTMKVANNVTLKKIVVITNCPIDFGQNDVLEDVIIGTYDTGDQSIKWSSGFQIGKDDSCAAGGGAQLLAMGGMKSAAALQAFGAQLLALKNIEFTANADGIEGASFISGDTVSGTSNMSMGFCGTGMEDNFEVDYFRLAY